MNKKEMREVTITYCDYCGKEITPPYTTMEFKDGRKVDLCSDYIGGEKTCFEKYSEASTRDKALQDKVDFLKSAKQPSEITHPYDLSKK